MDPKGPSIIHKAQKNKKIYVHISMYNVDVRCPCACFSGRTQGQRSDQGLAYLSLARLGLAAGPGLWRSGGGGGASATTLWHSVREVVKDGLAEDRQDFCPQSLACLEVCVDK